MLENLNNTVKLLANDGLVTFSQMDLVMHLYVFISVGITIDHENGVFVIPMAIPETNHGLNLRNLALPATFSLCSVPSRAFSLALIRLLAPRVSFISYCLTGRPSTKLGLSREREPEPENPRDSQCKCNSRFLAF